MRLRFFSFEIISSISIFLLSMNVSLWNISRPSEMIFDEFRYVSAGRQFLKNGINENWSHPPLAKWIIGQGIRIFGDQPLGWRLMSAVFGATTLVLMFFLALQILRNRLGAWLVFLFCFLNQMHFVQSRVAMLDVFMFTFMALGLVLFTPVFLKTVSSERQVRYRLAAAGVSFGFAGACKWYGFLPALICLVSMINDSSLGVLKKRIRLCGFNFCFLPVFSYLCACAVVIGMYHPKYAPPLISKAQSTSEKIYNFSNLIEMQIEMFKAQTNFSNELHIYASSWTSWPIMARPMWYTFTREINGRDEMAGVLFVGNIFILWAGVIAILFCGWNWLKTRNREVGWILALYFSFWLSWVFIPRQTTFFYYYYPAAMILSLALAYFIQFTRWPRWAVITFILLCTANFLFFYPLLTNAPMNPDDLQLRILFKTWV